MRVPVVIAIRSHNERHGWWHPNLGMWVVSLAGEQRYQIIIRSICGAPNAAASANVAADVFLRDHPAAEWLCIVDNDSVPPANVMRILDDLPEEVAVIGCVSHMLQHGKTSIQQGWVGSDDRTVDISGDRVRVDILGGGCWFIHRRVFAEMKPPYFLELYHPQNHMLTVSDDVYFQNKARELGFKLFCDTRFVISHYHTLDLASV